MDKVKRKRRKYCSSCGEPSIHLKCMGEKEVDDGKYEKIYRCRKCARKENKMLKKRIEHVHKLFGCS